LIIAAASCLADLSMWRCSRLIFCLTTSCSSDGCWSCTLQEISTECTIWMAIGCGLGLPIFCTCYSPVSKWPLHILVCDLDCHCSLLQQLLI
jgi:hypothetical protein